MSCDACKAFHTTPYDLATGVHMERIDGVDVVLCNDFRACNRRSAKQGKD